MISDLEVGFTCSTQQTRTGGGSGVSLFVAVDKNNNNHQVLHKWAGWLPSSHPPDPHHAWGETLPDPPGVKTTSNNLSNSSSRAAP